MNAIASDIDLYLCHRSLVRALFLADNHLPSQPSLMLVIDINSTTNQRFASAMLESILPNDPFATDGSIWFIKRSITPKLLSEISPHFPQCPSLMLRRSPANAFHVMVVETDSVRVFTDRVGYLDD